MIKKSILYFLSITNWVLANPTPLDWEFPRDYAPHPHFNTEWWYFTGHLTDELDKLYGFQVTFFRHRLTQVTDSSSPFNAPHLYTAHFAFTDGEKEKFVYDHIYARQSLGQVKLENEPFHLAVKEWSLTYKNNQFELYLTTIHGHFSLILKPSKPMIFHGNQGVSFKGTDRDRFSHYYSHPRLIGSGQFQRPDKTLNFTKALAWMDREIFDNLSGGEPIGWYWFSLQLDDQSEVMLFQVNGNNPYYSGTLIDPQGETLVVSAKDIEIKALESWKSPKTGESYPVKWKIIVSANKTGGYAKQQYFVEAVMEGQELEVSQPYKLSYWEGQALVSGTNSGKAYVEVVPVRD